MPNDNFNQTPYLQSGSPETEHRPADSYTGGQVGYRFTFVDKADSDIAKRYQLVQSDSVMDVVPYDGAVAFWLHNTGYLVTTDVSKAGRGNVAGVFVCAPDLGEFCCIQIGGKHPNVDFSAGTPDATGLIVIPTATDAKAEALAAGNAATYPPLGVTVGTATGSLAPVELNLTGRE